MQAILPVLSKPYANEGICDITMTGVSLRAYHEPGSKWGRSWCKVTTNLREFNVMVTATFPCLYVLKADYGWNIEEYLKNWSRPDLDLLADYLKWASQVNYSDQQRYEWGI